jgi:hypothetical protein
VVELNAQPTEQYKYKITMTKDTTFGRHVNSARTNISSPATGQLISESQQSVEHDASAKEEIQDFSSSSSSFTSSSSPSLLATSPSISNDEGVSTADKIDRLFQYPGRRGNTLDSIGHRRSWTDSRATYQNAARREYYLLLANPRQANHLVTVKYLREFSAQEIRARWSAVKTSLQQQGIIAFAVIEITTRPHVLQDESLWYYPINRVHYHCLVDSVLSVRRLRDIFKHACFDAGLTKSEFVVMYEAIPDRKTFEHKVKYILKFDNFSEQAILFRPEKEIGKLNKTCSIGRWFVNADGSRANKDKMWKSIVAGWYSK